MVRAERVGKVDILVILGLPAPSDGATRLPTGGLLLVVIVPYNCV